MWNDCIDAIPRYRQMKDQKRTDDFITAFCKELLERYPGADTLPGDTAFRQVRDKPTETQHDAYCA